MKNTIKIPKFWTRESILIFRTWPSQTLEISGKTQRKHPDVGVLKRYDHDKPRRQGAEVICFGKGPNMPEWSPICAEMAALTPIFYLMVWSLFGVFFLWNFTLRPCSMVSFQATCLCMFQVLQLYFPSMRLEMLKQGQDGRMYFLQVGIIHLQTWGFKVWEIGWDWLRLVIST